MELVLLSGIAMLGTGMAMRLMFKPAEARTRDTKK